MGNEYAEFFEEFTSRATNHCGRRNVLGISNLDTRVALVNLSAGKGMKATKKSETITPLNPEELWICWFGIVRRRMTAAASLGVLGVTEHLRESKDYADYTIRKLGSFT